jgi:rhodanese-related sulfurtransferase
LLNAALPVPSAGEGQKGRQKKMGMLQGLFGSRSRTAVLGVNAQELKQIMDGDQEVLLVDVRSPYEYEHDGHISGSRLLPLPALLQRVDELPKNQEIIFVCRSGNRSLVACEQLLRMGFSQVKNFEGGMIAWQMSGFPMQR